MSLRSAAERKRHAEAAPYAGGVHLLVAWTRRHPIAMDASLALGLIIVASLGRFGTDHPPDFLLVVALCAPLAFRRVAPQVAFITIAGVAFVQYVAGVRPGFANVAVLIALYTIVTYGSRRDAAAATGVVVVGVFLGVFRWSANPWVELLMVGLITLATVVIGETMRVRRAYLTELEARATRLERERDQQAEIAVAAERARIARELHDIVAHNVSVMVAQADGARYAIATDPVGSAEAMKVVARTGREALAEMRHVLGVLRPTGRGAADEIEPQPSIEAVGELVERLRDAGLEVELDIDGPLGGLPAGPALAAYRVVQEALTNALKHAGRATRTRVCIESRAEALEILVEDDGAPLPTGGRVHGGGRDGAHGENDNGHGLVGMRERAQMYGGFVETGRRANGGYRVHAHLPIASR
jgi:signal transduction histidine kinase